MTFDNLLIERDGAVASLTMNRPEVLNALSAAVLTELEQALSAIGLDPSVRVLVITGAGDRAFAAGADIKELSALTADQAQAHARLGQRVLARLEQLRKPVIAALNGFALGGGCELALACTLRIASERARLGQPEITLGLVPGFGGSQRLPRLIGTARALDLLLTGRIIAADEALAMGLVNRVTSASELRSVVTGLAQGLAAQPAQAMAGLLEAVAAAAVLPPERGYELESSLFSRIVATDDAQEGMRAFLEKRTPRFN